MPRLSCNQLTTYRWSFEEDLYHYQRAGYQAIGLWRRKLLDFGVERGLELIAESGLRATNLTWAGGFTGVDGRTLEECVLDARSAIQLAAAAGAGRLVVYSGGRNSHTTRHAMRLLSTALDELLPHAHGAGVTLALKPMHPACAAEWTFLTRLEDAARLVASYDDPRLKLAYDTYQFPLEGDRLGELAPLVGLVQLGDASTPHGVDLDRCLLGEGDTPLGHIIQTLLESGYEGDFDVELMGPSVEAVSYETLIAHSRRAFDTLAGEALGLQSL